MHRQLAELFSYRELIWNLTVRELKARYKSSVLGFFWGLLNPLAMMLVFSLAFSILWPNTQMEDFPIFLLCGLLPWNFFTSAVMGGTTSIVGGGNLLKKVYFPREVLPIASVLSHLVNFLLALLVLFAALLFFHPKISPTIWLLPFVIGIQTIFILGVVLVLSTLNVFYRDTVMIVDVVIMAAFFLTPVFYPIDFYPESYTIWGFDLNVHRIMRIVNPMASLITTYRDFFYYGYSTAFDFFLRTAVTAFVVFFIGYWIFRRYSGRFGEIV
jgi:lipopolysaccharide transport system permease protein